ncbi:MAG: TRAP transporter substrate-binding protein [Candidatus Odyssella sp.]|nr:TRAP transporter substrate-binding protein [Candidatus Odyssella sp.]
MNAKWLLTAVLASALAAPALAETELKFGHVGEPGSLFEASANEFAKRVNAKMAGKVKVSAFGSSQLGKDEDLVKKLKLGTVDFALPSTVMSSVAPEFGLFEMPYLVKNRDHMKKIEKEIVWTWIGAAAEAKGYRILAVWENGFRHITNNRKPIVTPADLAGVKLRVPGGQWRVRMFKGYGANPSPMAFSEVFTALKTGVMDAQENPLIQIYSAKFQEVQKYLSLTSHVYTPAYVVVGKEKWDAMDKAQRDQIEAIAKETQAFVYEQAAKFDDELLGKLKAAGMQVNEPNRAAFVEASKPIYEEFSKAVPRAKEMIDKALSLASGS